MLISNLHLFGRTQPCWGVPTMRLRRIARDERGVTLVELLVASAMGVVVMGAVASLVISAVRAQPKISQEANNITTAQWVLARMTRELRNGVHVNVKEATASRVSFETYVRTSACGGGAPLASESPAIKCQVTYECTTTTCSRIESPPGSTSGTPTEIFSGIDTNQVFSYGPSASNPTYVKVTLRLPSPSGSGALTVSDGASLRNATLGY
ncbi:MAG TPA: prepilin-type N-terminal cleavage/methylation domain-containing protein [Solirubrobacterales bacterium]|jgi:Tfp pilus assembly protein PilW|nr:prepilin-type N-terminal cleavage/methylation domain-containing protein [Solirubrobacterales bacterium]